MTIKNSIYDNTSEQRKKEEIEFHNLRELDRLELTDEEYQNKYSNKKFYNVQRRSTTYYHSQLRKYCTNKKVLDYCCGLGQTSLELAKIDAEVVGIDISDESVNTTRNLLKENGYQKKSNFFVMDAENMTFEDNSFDTVICSGVLHHLDVNKAFPEIARVLKEDGKVICVEALGYNPFIRLYRKLTPHLRTAWEVDHILTMKEIKLAKNYFNTVNVQFFHLCTLIAIPFQNTFFFKPLLSLCESLDLIACKIPFLKLWSWQMIFILSDLKNYKK